MFPVSGPNADTDWFGFELDDINSYYSTGLRVLLGHLKVDFVEEDEEEEAERMNTFMESMGCIANGMAVNMWHGIEGADFAERINENHQSDHDASSVLIGTGAILLLGYMVERGYVRVEGDRNG